MMKNTRKNLNKAFKQLRKKGYKTIRNIAGGCNCEIREYTLKKLNGNKDAFYVGYLSMYREAMNQEEFGLVVLQWQGDKEEILKILNENGIHAYMWEKANLIVLGNPGTEEIVSKWIN